MELIAEFEELQLNDFDFALKTHPAHDVMEMEQLNILNDLVGRLHGIETKTLSDIVGTEEQDNNLGTMFSWFDTLKIMGICTIGFILFMIVIRLFIACNIVPKLAKVRHTLRKPTNQNGINGENPAVTLQEILGRNLETIYNTPTINEPTFVRTNAPLPLQGSYYNRNNTPSAPKMTQKVVAGPENLNKLDVNKCPGPHTTCSYVIGHGMVWEDLCLCDVDEESVRSSAPKTGNLKNNNNNKKKKKKKKN